MKTALQPSPAPLLEPIGPSARVPAADGLRGLAALVIVLHHAAFVTGVSPRPGFIGQLMARLDVGVPVFFALSGFFLFRPYVSRIVADEPMPSMATFYRRRLARIFPGFWVAYLVQYALGALRVYGVSGFLFGMTLTHVYTKKHSVSGITQSWSLATELAFYALLPWFALWLSRRCRSMSPSRRLLVIGAASAGWIVVSLASRVINYAWNGGWEKNWRYTVFANADFFAVGLLCAVVAVGRTMSPGFRRLDGLWMRRPWVWYLVGTIAFVVTSTQLQIPRGLRDGNAQQELARQFGYFVVAVAFVAPACLARPGHRSLRFLSTRPIVYLGTISYGVYLWHQLLLSGNDREGPLLSWFGWPLFEAPLVPVFVMATAGSIVLGSLSWYLIEKPMIERFR